MWRSRAHVEQGSAKTRWLHLALVSFAALIVALVSSSAAHAQYVFPPNSGMLVPVELTPNGHRILSYDELVAIYSGYGADHPLTARDLEEMREQRRATPHPNFESGEPEDSFNPGAGNERYQSFPSGENNGVMHFRARESTDHTARARRPQPRPPEPVLHSQNEPAKSPIDWVGEDDHRQLREHLNHDLAEAAEVRERPQRNIVRRADGSFGPARVANDTPVRALATAEEVVEERLPSTDMARRQQVLQQANAAAAAQRADWRRRRAAAAALPPVSAVSAGAGTHEPEESSTNMRDLLELLGFGSLLGIGFGVFVAPRLR